MGTEEKPIYYSYFFTANWCAPCRTIKENELPQIKGGVVEGIFQSKDGILAISKLPSREVLYAQVVGGVSAPMYGIVGTLQANIQKLLFVLQAKAQS